MDVVVNIGVVRHFIDVSIVHPCAPKYMRGHDDVNHAAQQVVQRKMDKYGPLLPEVGCRLVPFVLETTGRLSLETAAFVDEVAGLTGPGVRPDFHKKRARQFFLKRIAVIIASNNAKMIMQYRTPERTHLIPSRQLGAEYLDA